MSSTPSTSKAQAKKADGAAVDAEEVEPVPNLAVAEARWRLLQPSLSHLHDESRRALLAGIKADEMTPFLEQLESSIELGEPRHALATELKAKNEAALKKLDEELEDAKTNMGETDLSDVLKRRALYLTRIGHHEQAVEAYTAALEKVVGLGARIDQRLALIRIGLFHGDHALTIANIAKAQELTDEGGDWDRRNRLKAYKGLHCLSIRDFKQGSDLLLDTLATFAATELMSYEAFVSLCIIAGTLTLSRVDFKKKIINSPEVIGVLPQLAHLKDFSTSLYNGEYAKFFRSLAEVETAYLTPSRLLSVHTRYYVREMRIKAYAQLLESYRSVTMSSLCSAFGVNEEWLDADLARFIAAGRLSVTIDKVNGVVETNRGDMRNARYEQVIKSGDALLNNLQRVSRSLSTTT